MVLSRGLLNRLSQREIGRLPSLEKRPGGVTGNKHLATWKWEWAG